jgi:hypothetical protein
VVPSPAASPPGGGTAANDSVQQVVSKAEPSLKVIDTTLQYNSQVASAASD